MTTNQTTAASSFKLAGQREVRRMGFGAMRLTGRGIWGPPKKRDEALRVLRALPELGVNFIDTADAYGPDVSEQLIREALHPYPEGMLIATKGGLTRPGPDRWLPNGRPEYLVAQAKKSRETLGVERIELWQLHRIDSKVPRAEQFAAIKELLDAGVIRYAGLSEVDVEELEAAAKFFPVTTVQNRYNLTDRGSDAVLDHCAKHGIGFIPWYPLAAGDLVREKALAAVAKRRSATAAQVALGWLLHRSPVMLPIPGTSSLKHLKENVAAATLQLSAEDMRELEGP